VPDRDPPCARGQPLRLPSGDDLRRDLTEFERAERRQHVLEHQLLVVQLRLQREARHVGGHPCFAHVGIERDPAVVHHGERPELLAPADLGAESDGVALAVEGLGPILLSLPPPHTPTHSSALQDSLLDLHSCSFGFFRDASTPRRSRALRTMSRQRSSRKRITRSI
jgi:hypothetical protein